MGQIDHSMLNMMQAITTAKPGSRPQSTSESTEDGGFRDLMNQHIQQANGQTANKDSAQGEMAQGQAADGDGVDEAVLQELAAMQMLCVDTMQIVAVPEEAAVPMMPQSVAPVAEQAAIVTNAPMQQQAEAQVEGEHTAVMQPAQKQTVETDAAPKAEVQKGNRAEVVVQEEQPAERTEKQQPEVITKKSDAKTVEDGAEGVQSKVFSQVETAPIKVGEAALQPEQPKSVESQVTDRLTEALQKGETKVELQLTPEHLGKITIELTKKGDGSIHVVLHAENSQTKTLLERDIFHMQSMLGRNTQQDVMVEVPRQQETAQKDFAQEQNHQQQHQQQEQKQQHATEDFLNQLRLGLAPTEEEAS